MPQYSDIPSARLSAGDTSSDPAMETVAHTESTLIAKKEFERTIEQHRDQVQKAISMIPPADVPYREITLPVMGKEFTLGLFRPKIYKAGHDAKTIIFIPGTGFVAREKTFTKVMCSHWADMTGFQVLILYTPLAPEYQFPTGLQATYSALLLIMTNAAMFKIEGHQPIIAGYSSGGNFAVVLSLLLKQHGFKFDHELLLSPYLDLTRPKTKHSAVDATDKSVPSGFVEWITKHYLGNQNPENPLASPMHFPAEELRKLPSTTLVCSRVDVFGGDTHRFAKKLFKAGAKASMHEYHSEISNGHSYLWRDPYAIQFVGLLLKSMFTPAQPARCPNHLPILLEIINTQGDEDSNYPLLLSKLHPSRRDAIIRMLPTPNSKRNPL